MTGDGDVLHEGEIEAQRRFGAEAAGRAMSRIIRDRLSPAQVAFIQAQPFFFIATANHRGECDCSFRGRQHRPSGEPAPALMVLDERTVVFPDYAGNNLFNSLGNILINPRIGMLFVDFQTGGRARVNGRAEIIEDRAAFQHVWPDAECFVRVTVEQAFPNCRQRVPLMAMAP